MHITVANTIRRITDTPGAIVRDRHDAQLRNEVLVQTSMTEISAVVHLSRKLVSILLYCHGDPHCTGLSRLDQDRKQALLEVPPIQSIKFRHQLLSDIQDITLTLSKRFLRKVPSR